jgi:ASC-1-like (ASCH) protein
MPRQIVKKILPEYFEEVASGKKKFEFRVADFEIGEGDTLVLEEWDSLDHATRKPTGRTLEKVVTFVRKLDLDSFTQRKELEQHGFYIVQFD